MEISDLFWAMRGGGAGPYGVVTAMTIKMHKPLDDCVEKCYHVTNVILVENFFTDQGEMMKEFYVSKILPESFELTFHIELAFDSQKMMIC